MLKRSVLLVVTCLGLVVALSAQGPGPRRVALGDWPEMRGPHGDGTSLETGLIDRWSLDGENLLWRVPHGGRSTPVVMGNRLYVQNGTGDGATLQERVMALDADTGRTEWEYRYNIYQSDAPPHRIAWASPAVDPETGNVYAVSAGLKVMALSAEGQLLWSRSFGEEWAAFTTHGGRTMSPIIDGNLVLVSHAVSSWGEHANRSHRFFALDKRTGEIVYVTNPGGRPFDTAYASPLITTISGLRMLVVGLGDGGVHAFKPQTGEHVWSFPVAKRAVNTGVAVRGDGTVYVSHGDENLEGNVMGLIAAVDGSRTGTISNPKWAVEGFELGFSSPVTDGTRLYQIDNGGTLRAFDMDTGETFWSHRTGNSQRAPLVLADGKLYVGTPAGNVHIIRPHADRAEVLSTVMLPDSVASCCGSEGTPEQIVSGVAISRGRIFFVSSDAVYAIGAREATSLTGWAVDEPFEPGAGAPAHLQVSPTEMVLEPGQTVALRARLFDDRGRFLREATGVTWALDGLEGTVSDGTFTVGHTGREQAGVIRASVGGVTGEARARVVRPLPWTEDFEGYEEGAVPPGWINMTAGRFRVTSIDGRKALQKEPLDTLLQRIRAFIGPTNLSNYTIAADVRAPEQRRRMGDVGITAQRYTLMLYGTTQRLKLEPWEPETERTVTIPFSWKPDKWYRLKLRVENLPDGQVRARGKAWPAGEPEPAEWLIDRTDPIGNREGSPGLFIDAQAGAYVDNLSVTPND
jgi:outer membrane protein assembly factor BamB